MTDFKIPRGVPAGHSWDHFSHVWWTFNNFKAHFIKGNWNCGYPSANASMKKGRPSLRSGLNKTTFLEV